MMAQPFSSQGFVGKARDDVKVGVHHFLPPDRTDVPADGVPVRLSLVQKSLSLLHKIQAVSQFLSRHLEGCRHMAPRNDHDRVFQHRVLARHDVAQLAAQ